MPQNTDKLDKSEIFKDIGAENIKDLLSRISYSTQAYKAGETILSQHQSSRYLGIILSGKAKVVKLFPSGKSIIIARFSSPQSFGEASLFAGTNIYVSSVIAESDSLILLLNKNNLIKLFSLNKQIMENYLRLLSGRLVLLNQKIALLSAGSIREKISYFLLDKVEKQKKAAIILPFSKAYLANYLCIPRPSLSRELSRMQDEGLISVAGKKILIEDTEKLEAVLL